MTAVTDALIGFAYLLAPILHYLCQGDKQPTPIDGLARNT